MNSESKAKKLTLSKQTLATLTVKTSVKTGAFVPHSYAPFYNCKLA